MLASAKGVLGSTADHPQYALGILFVLYKSLLLIITSAAPGRGYDVSTQLSGWPELNTLGRLVRWDAIWFTGLAREGYKWEQGWAFGWGYMQLLSLGQSLWPDASYDESIHREAIVGIVVSHVSHYLGTLLLYRISLIVFRSHMRGERIAFIAACLHVLSPAGIFLSAPYIEAPFSLLQFAGYFVYASAHLQHTEGGSPLLRDFEIVLSGALFGVSCLFRSNGLFSGAIFAFDAVEDGLAFLRYPGFRSMSTVQNLVATGVAGVFVGLGYVYPQFLAYMEYCTDRNVVERRPWCDALPPSVFSYVQEKYWYVGLFRYWSANSIPLFAMAAPLLIMTYCSSWWAWTVYRKRETSKPSPPAHEEQQQLLAGTSQSHAAIQRTPTSSPRRVANPEAVDFNLIFRFALPQFLVATVCFFIANVQIITRLSSGYLVWYWWLADWIVQLSVAETDEEDVIASPSASVSASTNSTSVKKSRSISIWPGITVKFCIMYGIIQAGLFAEFLPPA